MEMMEENTRRNDKRYSEIWKDVCVRRKEIGIRKWGMYMGVYAKGRETAGIKGIRGWI